MPGNINQLVLRLAPHAALPDAQSAGQLGSARDAMLRELPRVVSAPVGTSDGVPASAPCASVPMRVAHWQTFVRCAQHLPASSYPRAQLLPAMAASLAEACGPSVEAAAHAQQRADVLVRVRESDYVQQAMRALREPACAGAEARRQQARDDLRRAYRELLASTSLPSRGDVALSADAATSLDVGLQTVEAMPRC